MTTAPSAFACSTAGTIADASAADDDVVSALRHQVLDVADLDVVVAVGVGLQQRESVLLGTVLEALDQAGEVRVGEGVAEYPTTTLSSSPEPPPSADAQPASRCHHRGGEDEREGAAMSTRPGGEGVIIDSLSWST